MEEKLNMIYEKLLDLEIAFKEVEHQKRLKELEAEKRHIQYRIDGLKYIKEKELERKAELISFLKMLNKLRRFNIKMTEEEKKEHYKSCWESTVKELNNLAKYTNYLEEKLMYALGPKNTEFSDNLKYHFSNILRKSYYDNRDTYQIKESLIKYYKHEEKD